MIAQMTLVRCRPLYSTPRKPPIIDAQRFASVWKPGELRPCSTNWQLLLPPASH
jgi:hypothetical protein